MYIDYINFKHLVGQFRDPENSDIERTVRNQLDVKFNFSKADLTENENLLLWATSNLTHGVGESTKDFLGEGIFPGRPLKSNCYNVFPLNCITAIFLLCDEKAEKVKEKNAILIGEEGEEVQKIREATLYIKDYQFDESFTIGSDFTNWSQLHKYAVPLTDLLIVDPYLLQNIELPAFESNLINLIHSITVNACEKVNLVVYTNFDLVPGKIKNDFKTFKSAIKKAVSKIGYITIIMYRDQRGRDSFAEHDRCIITNYSRLKSGDTFTGYFNLDGTKKTKGRDLTVQSLVKKKHYVHAIDVIKTIQKNLEQLEKLNERIIGNKKSFFLKFRNENGDS